MNPMTRNSQTTGTVNGKHSTGEACMVAFARNEMNEVKAMVDRAMGLTNAIACQAVKASDTTLPAVGSEKDVSSLLTDASDAGAEVLGLNDAGKPTIELAKVERVTETLFKTTVTLADPEGRQLTVIVRNDAKEEGDEGVISISRQPRVIEIPGSQDNNNILNKKFLVSIKYKQDKAANVLKAELRHAAIVNTETHFNPEGIVALERLPEQASNSVVHAIKYLAFDMNTETNAGKLSYWRNPGGSLIESARGFLFNLEETAGVLSGCGESGATQEISIRSHLIDPENKALKATRYFHPFFNQNTHPDKNSVDYSAQMGAKIAKQCFKRDSESGLYLIDTDITTSEKGYAVIPTVEASITPPAKPE